MNSAKGGRLFFQCILGIILIAASMNVMGQSAPTATTSAATGVGSGEATLNGTVNANGASTTVTFEYGSDTNYHRSVDAVPKTVTGSSDTAVNASLSDLTPGTTYYYRVVAFNAGGTTYGASMTFTTMAAPTVTTDAASVVSTTGATLNGTVNANGASTTVTFEYGLTTSYGTTVTADQSPVTGNTNTAVSKTITGLTNNTVYHYRVVGQNVNGTTYGSDKTFFTALAEPTVTTQAATNIGNTSATLNGTVNANNNITTVTFQYGPNTGYGRTVIANQSPVTGSTDTAVSVNLDSLSPDTTYHYRVVATNSSGTAYGSNMTFTTGSTSNLPTVTTAPVTKITFNSAKCGGNVTDEGGSAVTTRGVCWSTVPNPTLADNFTVNDAGPGPFNSTLNYLTESTTYYVRAYATNSYGTAYGEEFQFTTHSKDIKVTIIKPLEGEEVSGTVIITVNAEGTAGSQSIARVEVYIDGTRIAELTKEPFKTDWDTTTYIDGSHTIKAAAYNENNQHAENSVMVRVNNSLSETPEIAVNRERFAFGAVPKGKSGYRVTGVQTLLIDNSGGGILNWTISTDAEWLSTSPASGTGSHVVKVSVDLEGKAAGSYSSSLEITAPNSSNGMVTVDVQLTIYNKGTSGPPFGTFETPAAGAMVRGIIPVSGWVLDDIEVTRIAIYRSPVGKERGLKYIGDAIMVDSARPDIEETYPDYPLNYQAGWGYLLLTNSLPNQGNGTFKLHAKATDKEGNTATLGSKTIKVDNANAIKPFGTIDTPAPGEIAAGSHFANFGWALTPQPNTIPFNGSTIIVWVDGLPLGNPVYNRYRKDIAHLFPGYNNSDGAGGYFYLDTTSYSNGIHTIAWSVTDDAGNSEGIGSRYFYIVNNGTSGTTHSIGMTANSLEDLGHIEPRQVEPTFIKKGYRPDGQAEVLFPDEQGRGRVTIKELEPVELELANNAAAAWGYLVTGGRLRDLPAGSTLDHKSGRFSWLPGPGHFGKYLMVFVIKDTEGRYTRTLFMVTIEPKFNK